jgi:hypothetical protein
MTYHSSPYAGGTSNIELAGPLNAATNADAMNSLLNCARPHSPPPLASSRTFNYYCAASTPCEFYPGHGCCFPGQRTGLGKRTMNVNVNGKVTIWTLSDLHLSNHMQSRERNEARKRITGPFDTRRDRLGNEHEKKLNILFCVRE